MGDWAYCPHRYAINYPISRLSIYLYIHFYLRKSICGIKEKNWDFLIFFHLFVQSNKNGFYNQTLRVRVGSLITFEVQSVVFLLFWSQYKGIQYMGET